MGTNKCNGVDNYKIDQHPVREGIYTVGVKYDM